jgi:chemotaxis protein histidine kinase CheA
MKSCGGGGNALDDIVPASIDNLTTEILILKRQTAANIIEIGKRLLSAKEMVGHGQWLPYLQDKVQFTERTAQRFMKAAKEFPNTTMPSDLEPWKVIALLDAPPEEREHLVSEAPDMTTRQLEEAVREANRAKREAEEAKRRATDAEARAKAAEARPPQVVEKVIEVVKSDPALVDEIANLRRSLHDKERTLTQRQQDYDRVQKFLSTTNQELNRLREQMDFDGTLSERITEKERQLRQLTELHKRIGVQFDEEGRDPDGGLKLLRAIQPIESVIIPVIGDVRLLKRAGVGGWSEDGQVKELSERLKQLATLLDDVLADRKTRSIIAEVREVRTDE